MKVFIIVAILVAVANAAPYHEHSRILVRIDDPSIFDAVSDPVYPPLEQPAQEFRLVPENVEQTSYVEQSEVAPVIRTNDGSTSGQGYTYSAPQESQSFRSSSSSEVFNVPVPARLVHSFTEEKVEQSPVTGSSYQSSYTSRQTDNGNSESYASQSSYSQPRSSNEWAVNTRSESSSKPVGFEYLDQVLGLIERQ